MMLRGVVTLVHLVDIERDFHMEKNRSQNPSSKSVRASPSDHRYYAAAVVGITPTRPSEARSVCGGDAAAIIFYFLAAPIERRERERKGREWERRGETDAEKVRPSASASVIDLREGECKTKQKPQIDSGSEGRGGDWKCSS